MFFFSMTEGLCMLASLRWATQRPSFLSCSVLAKEAPLSVLIFNMLPTHFSLTLHGSLHLPEATMALPHAVHELRRILMFEATAS